MQIDKIKAGKFIYESLLRDSKINDFDFWNKNVLPTIKKLSKDEVIILNSAKELAVLDKNNKIVEFIKKILNSFK